jgi:hypothetical protein
MSMSQDRKYVTKTISTIDHVITKNSSVPGIQRLIDKGFDRYIKLARFQYQNLDQTVVKQFIADASATDLTPSSVAQSMDRTILQAYRTALLAKSKSVAEQNVTDVQRESSGVIKGKESAVTSADVLKAMNTGYIYVPVVTDYKEEVKDNNASAEISGYILWYHLVTDATGASKFALVEEKPETQTGSGSGDIGKSYSLLKRSVDGREYARIIAIDNWARNLSLAMRRNPEFQLSGEIKDLSGSEVAANLGTREGVDLDEGFTLVDFYEKDNGEIETRTLGFFRAKSVANNDPGKGGNPQNFSTFANYIGHGYERGMLLAEHPRMGLDIDIRAKYLKLNIPQVSTVVNSGLLSVANGPLSLSPDVGLFTKNNKHPFALSEDAVDAVGLDLNFRYNLARILGIRQLFIAVDLSGAYPLASYDKDAIGTSSMVPLTYNVYVGLLKKLWFGRANLNIGAGVGGDWLYMSRTATYGELESMTIGSLGAKAEIGLEYLATPDFMIGVTVGYKYGLTPFDGTMKFQGISPDFDLTKNDVLTKNPFYKDLSFTGLSATFGFSISLPSFSSNPFSGLESSKMDY